MYGRFFFVTNIFSCKRTQEQGAQRQDEIKRSFVVKVWQ